MMMKEEAEHNAMRFRDGTNEKIKERLIYLIAVHFPFTFLLMFNIQMKKRAYPLKC